MRRATVALLVGFLGTSMALGAACSASSGDEGPGGDYDAGRRDRDSTELPNPVGEGGTTGQDAGPDADTTPRGEVVVGNLVKPRGVAVDDTHVYFGVQGGSAPTNQIMKTPVGGGPATKLADGLSLPIVKAMDATDVYAIDGLTGGRLIKVPKNGGAVVELAPNGTGPTEVALDAANVYFGTGDGKIKKVAKTGGTVSDLVTGEGYMHELAVNNQYIFYNTRKYTPGPVPQVPGTYEASLRRVVLAGGTSTLIHEPSFKGDQLYGLALAGDTLLWTNSSKGLVHRKVGDGAVEVLGGSSGDNCANLVTDGTMAYWINNLGSATASIARAPVDKSRLEERIALDQDGAYGIAVGQTHVFWANIKEGAIRRTLK